MKDREEYISILEQDNAELKKQLEVSNELVAQGTLTEMKLRNEFNRRRKEYQDTYKDVRIEIKEYKTQQKEFIKYINDGIKELEKERPNKLQNTINLGIIDIIKTILQKYKNIIGVSDENNKQ